MSDQVGNQNIDFLMMRLNTFITGLDFTFLPVVGSYISLIMIKPVIGVSYQVTQFKLFIANIKQGVMPQVLPTLVTALPGYTQNSLQLKKLARV